MQFNQPVSPETATNLNNYVLETGTGTVISLRSAQLAANLTSVSLSVAGSQFVVGDSYNLAVSGVADILSATNTVASTNLAFTFASSGNVGISNYVGLEDQTITENQPVQFSVSAAGQGPYGYQWLYYGAPLAGQTNATLSFVGLWNSGGNYAVVVNNQFSSITSAPPTVLTVAPKTTPPQLIGVRGLAGTLNAIVLTFNEPVDPVTATNPATFSATGLSLLGASISTNGLQVTLNTTPQSHGQSYQLAIANLKDLAHVPNTLTVTVQFVSTISYRDEVLSEPGIVRYWTFDQTNGTEFTSLVSKYDTSPLNIVGTIER